MLLTTVTIDVSLILHLLLALAGVAALIALAVFLFKLAALLTSTKKLVDHLEQPLAETLTNVEAVSGNLVDMTDDLAEFLTPTLEDVGLVLEDAKVVVGSATEVVASLTGVLANILGLVKKGTRSVESVARSVKTATQIASVAGSLKPKKRKKARFF